MPPASTQLWFMLIELNSFSLSPQFSGTERVPAPYTCELVLRPYRTDRYCDAFRFDDILAVNRFSRIGVL
jgi:hypothetical protein